MSDLRGGHTERRIGNLVMQQLFDRAPSRETLGRYSVLDRIGRGGMGTVFAAYDDRLDRKIAIKLLGTTGGGSKAAALRLEREAQAMARLSHPNVATVHEVGEADGQIFIAMEFIRGQDLEAWFETQPSWRAVLEAFLQAGRGIIAAHEAGLVHRDLKPHNIMRTEDGTVKVLDFGLARADGELAEESSVTESGDGGANPLAVDLTKTGAVLGTPAYMSPEQHRGEPADARSDQFSFCVALFQGLYGTLPFEGPTLLDLVERVLEHRLEPIPSDARVPAWVHRVVVRGLSLEPEERWPSMQALLQALHRDPAQARRRWLTVGTLAGVTGLLGFGLAQLGAAVPSDCPTAQDEREVLWSEERRARVAAGLYASGSPLAADTLSRTSGPIEGYVDTLGQMRAASCEAHRAGRESSRLHDLRTACLDIRRAGMDQLLVQLESADASTVGNTAWAIASLPSVGRCGDAVALTAGVAPPEDPEIARRTQQQREALASVLSLAMTGSYDEAIARGEDARAEADSIGYEPLQAEAELTLGAVFMEAHQPDQAHDALSRAIRRGLRSMHHEAAVDALARRMWVLAEPLGRPEEALAIDEIAEAMLEHLDRPPVLHWRVLNNRAVAQFQAGAIDDAERSYHEALEVLATDGEERHPVEGISTRFNLAMLQSEGLGRPDVAAQELLAARTQATELLGSEHPRVLMLDSFLAENLSLAGRLGRARVELERLRERIAESDPYNRVLLLVELARVHHLLREHAAGLEVSEEALALATRTLPDEPVYAIARWHRGLARIGGGSLEEGIADLQGAVLHQREHAGPGTEALANAHVWAGLGLRRAGRAEEAIEAFERGYAIAAALGASGRPLLTRSFFELVDVTLEQGDLVRADALLEAISRAQDEASFSADSQYRLELLWRRGALWSGKGERAKALDAYERACTGLARHYEATHPALAGCRLAYAQARGSGDRARELARQAAEAYRALGEGFADEEARARAFVAALSD